MKLCRKILSVLLLAALILSAFGSTGFFAYAKEDTAKDRTEQNRIGFSHDNGFYDNEFDLYLCVPNGYHAYYTTDGSVPTVKSQEYESPIHVYNRSKEPNLYRSISNISSNWKVTDFSEKSPVTKVFVLRVLSVAPDGTEEIINKTYIVGLDTFKERNIVSLIVDPDDLFGGKNGIYVTGDAYDHWYLNGMQGEAPELNYEMKGDESERDADFQYFSYNEYVFEQPVGIRIQGAAARHYTPRRFSVYSRKEYSGSSYFDYDFFDGKRTHSVVLREGFENAFTQSLMQCRDIATTDSVPVTLFINGEYWYTCYMQEKYSERYIEETYGVDKDDAAVLKVGYLLADEKQFMTDHGFDAVYDLLENKDMKLQSSYKKLNELIDVQSYIDFMCANVILSNLDYDEDKNYLIWKSEAEDGDGYNDGRWRWGLYDMDLLTWEMYSRVPAGSGITEDYQIDAFSIHPLWTGHALNQTKIYTILKENEQFRKQFVLTYMDMINTNFTAEHVTEKLLEFGKNAEEYRHGFYLYRPQYAVKQLKNEFGLSGSTETLDLYVNKEDGGYIVVNTVAPEFTDRHWSGRYFADYPVTVTAVPAKGYEFVQWYGDAGASGSDTIDITLKEGGVRMTACFRKKQ